MKIFISKQLNKYLAEGFPMLDTDYGKHVLPEPDAMRDFKKQSGWVGKDGSGYPMFPHITKDEYEHRAYDLRDDNSITALIHYNPNGKPGRKARASKHRILDLPPTRFNDKFAEIVFYSITDNEVIAYYLVTYPTRLAQLMLDTVYDIEGNIVDDHDELRNILKDDEYTSNQIRNFVTKSQVGEERQVESFSQITQLTDRMSSVIGYIKTDPKTGEQMLTDRFGSVKGWYKPKYDMTFDRYSRVVGRGNLLSTLLNKASFREGLERLQEEDDINKKYSFDHIEFYVTPSGEDVVLKFIDDTARSNPKLSAKMVADMYKLDKLQSNAKPPLSKHIGDGIFELRTKQGSNISRCLYFFIYGSKIIITNGFIKKTDKTPQNEIALAKHRRNEYLGR